MYKPFDAGKLYDRTNHGLASGMHVQIPDGRRGHVVIGSTERSLVSYSPAGGGFSEARDWFENASLLVEEVEEG
jgi:hypothetical protein